METQKNGILKDATFLIGIGSILLSLGIFCLPGLMAVNRMSDSFFGIFFLNYFISIIFFIVVSIREISGFRLVYFQQKVEYGFIHLLLCLISAYALNREIPVFEKSTNWLQIFLLLQGAILLLAFVKHLMPNWLQFVFWLCIGIIFTLFLYLTIYLIPIFPFGIIAGLALGLSLHAFVPLGFTIALILFLVRRDNRKKRNIAGFSIGIIMCAIVSLLFMIQWNHDNTIINRASDKSLMDEKNDLPEWVVIAQHMPQNPITEKILKTGLVYSTASEGGKWDFFDLPGQSFDEVRKHDPFVMMATFFFGKPNLTEEQKIKVLEVMYDSRHKAQQRLWSGDNLQTSHIVTNVRLYPNLRLAYTEKVISVRNNIPKKAWLTNQEAIYTFHLPEGAVITSLSLWIKGNEEKAILTSKGKADTAYRSIVGIERRDPSLVRWQEGNTVSVRIFPCTPDEDRRFKIGITSPLRSDTDKLRYENIWFDGPVPFSAQESIKIQTMDNLDNMVIPAGFKEAGEDTWMYEGKYLSDWNLKMPVIPMQPNAFLFDGRTYQLTEYVKTYQYFNPAAIYLDINNQWTKSEFEQIRKLASPKDVYVFQNQLVKITDENAVMLFEKLASLNFSVFPLYEISHPENSLLITKGTMTSPNLNDLGESGFNLNLKACINETKKLSVFNLNRELSPFLKTLKELRAFDYDFGSMDYLAGLLTENRFIVNQENPETVIIKDSGIKITETAGTTEVSNTPDHVMRLFAYNNVMFSAGTHYLEKDYYDQTLVDKAYKAYIVSPVTSLVVLETQEDYKRFGITDDGKSLKNASMKAAGAVPEPHEWLLIIMLAGVAAALYLKERKKLKVNRI
jgi:XrtN system VIT domain protein